MRSPHARPAPARGSSTSFVPRERAELVPNKDYWDKARVPKLDRLVLLPLPEANARVAALRSGQVDWIEAPPPDAVPGAQEGRGFQIVTNAYPHNWTWHLSRVDGSPWNDVRVRKAANLAIDRAGLKELLTGLMIPAEGFVPPGHQWFGNPTFKLKYDVAAAKKLLAEAGYGPAQAAQDQDPDLGLGLGPDAAAADERVRAAEPRRGRHRGRVRRRRVERADQHLARRREARPSVDAAPPGSTSPTSSRTRSPASSAISSATSPPPGGTNWGFYCDPEMDKLFDAGAHDLRPKRADARCCTRSTRNTSTRRCS